MKSRYVKIGGAVLHFALKSRKADGKVLQIACKPTSVNRGLRLRKGGGGAAGGAVFFVVVVVVVVVLVGVVVVDFCSCCCF